MTPHCRSRRLASVATIFMFTAVLFNVGLAPDAAADAAGPTDYRTDIVGVSPTSTAFSVEMIGGDAFMRLVQLEPVEIVVVGYRNEPYLRFDADGTVVENRRSPSTWLNEERYGTDDPLPAFVDHEAPPQWRIVATNGAYSWHDHRSHWMNPTKPPGAAPGDQVLEAVVRLEVDGQPVNVTVASYLLEPPSLLPPIAGGFIGLALAAVAVRSTRTSVAMIAGTGALAALVVGAVAFGSVPTETGPTPLLWLLPVVATVAAALLLLLRRRLATTVYLDGLAVVAGAALLGWAIMRFDAIRRALIPSATPAAVDRLVVIAVAVIAAATIIRGLGGLIRPERLIDPA